MTGGPEITIVAHDIGPVGGMEIQLSHLIGGLLEDGWRVTVISRTCKLPGHKNLRWIRVPGPGRPFCIAYPWFLLVGSLYVWRRKRGVVHTTGAIVLHRAQVCTVHFCHRAVRGLPAFSRASRPGVAYRLNAWLAARMSRLFERWCYRPGRVLHLVGVSTGVSEELRRHFPRMRDRVLMIPNGVDTSKFRPGPAGGDRRDSGAARAIFVGSEWERKGLQFAIEALEFAPEASLTVVGEGDEKSYLEIARRIKVDDRVTFVGSSTDVASWYGGADVFLLPTAYETFSLVSYEAAASGLPLLVTKVNGVEDLLRDGVNGWFVERDAEGIAARLRALAADPARRQAMGSAARSESLKHSWSSVVSRYQALYAEAAA